MKIRRDWKGRKDGAVSEVIGYILVFSMVTVLLTTSIMLYVPEAGTNNELTYQASDLQVMQSIGTKLFSTTQSIGSQISEVIPTGITGAFLTQTTPTSVGFSKNSSSFSLSYSLKIGIQVQGYNPGTNLSYSKVINTTRLGGDSGPIGIVSGPFNYLYVLNYYSRNIAVISPSTGKYLGSSGTLGGTPLAITYDSGDNTLLVTYTNDYIQKISVSETNQVFTFSVVLSLNTKSTIFDLAYDPSTGDVLVGTESTFSTNSPGINVYNASTFLPEKVLTNRFDQSAIPSAITYDPANGVFYIAGGYYVWAINSVTYNLSNIYSVYSPWSIAFDTYNGNIYSSQDTTSGGASNLIPSQSSYKSIWVYNATSASFVQQASTKTSPSDLVYDPANRYVYVCNYFQNSVAVFNGMDPSETSPIQYIPLGANSAPGAGFNSILYDTSSGNVFVCDFGTGSVSIIQGNTVLGKGWTISDTGMPLDHNYSNGGSLSTSGATSFVQQQSYSLQDGSVVATDPSGNGQIMGTLPVTFNQTSGKTGLTMNSVQLNGNSNFSVTGTNGVQVTLTLRDKTVNTLSAGEIVKLQNTTSGTSLTAEILNIRLSAFSFTVNSPSFKAWDYAYYRAYVNSSASSSYVDSLSSWSSGTLKATVSGSTVTFSLVKNVIVSLSSVTVGYYKYSAQIG